MLVEFSVGNFWSFKEIQTLQMRAAKISSKYPKLDKDNLVVVDEQLSLLKSKAVFGANGSGKSNLVRAMVAMLNIIEDSLKDLKALDKNIAPFAFNSDMLNQPTFFQIAFVYDNVLFRYGFEASSQAIISEWLFGKTVNAKKGSRERFYFVREGNNLEVNESLLKEAREKHLTKSGTDTPPLFRENTLYLTLLATYNVSLVLNLLTYLQDKIVPIFPELSNDNVATNAMLNPRFQRKVTELLNAIDPTIEEIIMENGIIFVVRHIKEANEVKTIKLKLASQEAEGTKKVFELSPYAFMALEQGGVLIIDEFDAKMHPRLTRQIVELFHSPSTNKNNAQLVFITHNSKLLDPKLLRRDQISFAKKDKNGVTELYSLVEFKGIRNDASFENDYLLGKYRAVPTNLNQLEVAFEKN